MKEQTITAERLSARSQALRRLRDAAGAGRTSARRHSTLRLNLIFALLTTLLSLGAAAQSLPSALKGAKQPAQENQAGTAQPQKSLEERIEAARARVGEVRLRRQALDDPGYAPPAGITQREVDDVRTFGDRLVMFSESALRSLEAQVQLQVEQRTLAAASAAWQGFDEKPPYSILLVDALSEQQLVQQKKLESVQARISASEQLVEEFRAARGALDKAARSAAEASELERENQALATWRWKAAVLHVESTDAFIAWSLAELGRVKVERSLTEARISLLQRQLSTARSALKFTQEDLTEALSHLDREITELEAQFRATAAENKQLGRELAAAQQEVENARRAAAGGLPAAVKALETAEDQLRVVLAQADSARTRGEIFTVQLASRNEMKKAWNERLLLINGESALVREAAANRLRVMMKRAETLIANGQADITSFKAEADESVERLAMLDAKSDEALRERQVLEAIREKYRVADRQLRAIMSGLQTIERWLEASDPRLDDKPVRALVRKQGAEVSLLLQRLWELEIFSIDDTMEIGGETVTVARPVTVRKIVTVGLWVVFGLLASTSATRYTHRRLIEHYGVGPAQAKVLRRWMNSLNVLILLLIGLYMVRIPLTAFAFLGGALAIGFGFGTQTLIKNLVSGVLMLLERQIRAGDVVDIGGIVGTVTAVDVRSTRVRNFDGKETIIPNSEFLEGKFTNWTLGDRRIRLSIQVGVAHSSPARAVSELLVKCAESHHKVLKDPAPFVHLREFADNALVLELFFWIEVGESGVGAAIASDLRFMVDQALKEHAIEIPWPQRDLHVRQTSPLRVALEPPSEP
jgi:potassium efflux system protein